MLYYAVVKIKSAKEFKELLESLERLYFLLGGDTLHYMVSPDGKEAKIYGLSEDLWASEPGYNFFKTILETEDHGIQIGVDEDLLTRMINLRKGVENDLKNLDEELQEAYKAYNSDMFKQLSWVTQSIGTLKRITTLMNERPPF